MEAAVAVAQVEKPGDQALTCDQLHAEATALEADVMAMTKEVETIAMRQQSGAIARQRAGSLAKQALSGLASTLIPGAGGLIGMGIGATSGSTMRGGDRAAAMMKALQPVIDRQTFVSGRLRHVGMLYAEKCTADAAAGSNSAQP
jgi:hypothetical protein